MKEFCYLGSMIAPKSNTSNIDTLSQDRTLPFQLLASLS